ncbi:MAG: serine hydrolase [Halioglobus sp.]|nr:serine hydrolase [Halioglobus sp.]
MTKKVLAGIVPAFVLGVGALWWYYGASALSVGTGLAAKLACSGRYLSGFDAQRIEDDLAVYSEFTRPIAYRWLPEGGVRASLLGAGAVARYREGLGCTLDYGASGHLDDVEVQPLPGPSGEPWPLGTAAGPPQPQVQTLVEDILEADNTAGLDTRALLVVHRGRIAGEAYGEGIDRDTPLLGWSMGKSVIAIMLGHLERLGLVSVGERGLFEEWSGDGRAGISLENMLQMSSGLRFEEDYQPGSDATRMLFESPAAATVPLASPLEHQPGEFFSYSSGTTNLLSRLIVERVGGTPQAQVDFFLGEIAAPMGLRNTILEPDASGVFVGSSFVYATARDWARFGQLMVGGGVINGRRIVSADWVARATRPNTSNNDRRYGYHFWLNDGVEKRWESLPRSAYAMMGNRRQVVMMLPDSDAVIVRLGWTGGDYPTDRNFSRIAGALAQ